MKDVIVRVFKLRLDQPARPGKAAVWVNERMIHQQTVMEYFYDNPKDISELIKSRFGDGRYLLAKCDAKMRHTSSKMLFLDGTKACDCSLQRIMIRGCQDPNHH